MTIAASTIAVPDPATPPAAPNPATDTTAPAPAHDEQQLIQTDSLRLRIPTRLEWVGKVAEMLRQRAEACGVCSSERGMQLIVALHEALTNAIVHGNLGISSALKEGPPDAFAQALAEHAADPVLSARQVTVHYSFDGEQCTIRIIDEGNGFDFQSWIAKLDKAEAQGDAPSELCSGRGILLMRALVDEVHYAREGREVVLQLNGPHHRERRRDDRNTLCQPIRVLPVQDDGSIDWKSAWDALTRDASPGGMALLQHEASSAKRLLLELNENGRPAYVPAEVCHVMELDGGLIQIGCRFTTDASAAAHDAHAATLTPRPVARLLEQLQVKASAQTDAQPPQQKGHERRASLRVPYSAQVHVRVRAGRRGVLADSGEFHTAFSRDISRGGMAIVTGFELPRGTDIELLLPPAANGAEERQVMHAQVVRCQRVISAGVYDIGCQFVNRDSPAPAPASTTGEAEHGA